MKLQIESRFFELTETADMMTSINLVFIGV